MYQGPYSMLPPPRSPSDLVKAETLFLSCSDHLYHLVLNSAVLLVISWGPHLCTAPFWITLFRSSLDSVLLPEGRNHDFLSLTFLSSL